MEGFLQLRWAKWKRVLLTRSIALVPCVIIAALASSSLDYLDEYINVEQSLLVSWPQLLERRREVVMQRICVRGSRLHTAAVVRRV